MVTVHARLAVGLLVLAAGVSCDGDRRGPDGRTEDARGRPVGGPFEEIGQPPGLAVGAGWTVQAGLISRERPGGREPLLALAGAGRARDTVPASWPPGAPANEGAPLGKSFSGAAPSPDGEWLCWWTAGAPSLLGAVGSGHGQMIYLEFVHDAVPVDVRWAPAGGYVAVVVEIAREGGGGPASDVRHLRVYDIPAGRRLRLPWEDDCLATEGCEVRSVRWEGGTLLDVSLGSGAGEPGVPYEVDVAELEPWTMEAQT